LKLRAWTAVAVMILAAVWVPFLGLITASAAAPDFNVIVQEYSAETKTYIPVTKTEPSNVVRVVIERTNVLTNLGGIRFKLAYNKNAMECQAAASVCCINDSKGMMTYTANAEKGEIIISWDTMAANTSPSGNLFTVSFVVKETTVTSASFDLTILDLYDSSDKDISSVKTASASVLISKITFTEATLNIFRALSAITYPGSLTAIVTAENTFAEFSASQVAVFRNDYPALYNDFVSARNKYNELAGQAVAEKILQEASAFRTENARVLSLTTDTVAIADDADVKKASTMLEAMSPQARALITQGEKDLIKALGAKITELKRAESDRLSALSDANDFINSYQTLWGLSDTLIKNSYDSLAPSISEALAYYNSLLSNEAKAHLTAEKAYLDSAQALINSILAGKDAERKTMEKVTAFQLRWVKLFSLNAATVTIADETALKLMLDDLNAQDADVREKLAGRKTFAENLLSTISSKKDQLPGTTEEDDTDNDNPANNPGANETENTGTNDNQGDGGSGSNNNNAGTQAADKEDTKPSAAKPIVLIRDIPLIIKVLSLMLLGAILLMIYPAFMYVKMLRNEGAVMRNGRFGESL